MLPRACRSAPTQKDSDDVRSLRSESGDLQDDAWAQSDRRRGDHRKSGGRRPRRHGRRVVHLGIAEPADRGVLPRVDSVTFADLRTSPTFCVNVLASDQEALCRTFAVSVGAKFAGVGWTAGLAGAPILDGAVCWIECEWGDVLTAGDHHIVLGNVIDLGVQRASLPLLFLQGG
jgi:hypothetical protein